MLPVLYKWKPQWALSSTWCQLSKLRMGLVLSDMLVKEMLYDINVVHWLTYRLNAKWSHRGTDDMYTYIPASTCFSKRSTCVVLVMPLLHTVLQIMSMDMPWNEHRSNILSKKEVCPSALSMQFCFPCVENEEAENLSQENLAFCTPLKRKAWTCQSSAGFFGEGMKGNGSSEQCDVPVVVHLIPAFDVLSAVQNFCL